MKFLHIVLICTGIHHSLFTELAREESSDVIAAVSIYVTKLASMADEFIPCRMIALVNSYPNPSRLSLKLIAWP